MMKRVGYPAETAGAVEVSSSVNGQIMPPVMGAAAFLMIEYVGIPYTQIIKHAVLPAVISYIALFYIVHIEAVKRGLRTLPRPGAPKPWLQRLMGVLLGFLIAAAIAFAVYYGIGWIKPAFGAASPWVIAALVAVVYVGLVAYAARFPELELDDPSEPIVHLPAPGPVLKTGLHFILPVIVLVWCLMVEQFSPGLSAFYASALMIAILLTQRPLFALFRRQGGLGAAVRRGFDETIDGLITGARNMIGIAIATATAGIIVGTVSLTGIGGVLADLVEVLSLGNILLMLLLTGLLSLVLGMGLPTTANYIVVSSLLAPVIVEVGQANGLIVPLIAVHLFVFYFGIMADVTPPVGLASFAAAAISGADPIRTGIVATFYSLRTALLPFLFIYNTDLLLIEVGFLQGVMVFIIATIAMLLFAAATQGWFLTKSRWYESLLLLLIAFALFRPGFFLDLVVPPFEERPGSEIAQAVGAAPPGSQVRVAVLGQDEVGNPRRMVLLLPVGEGATGEERLEAAGLAIMQDDGKTIVDNAAFDSPARAAGFDFDQEILNVQVPRERVPKEIVWLPALALLALIALMQRGRRQRQPALGAA
jgi:TRAP transporter 4TM/12TM fusion protein